MPTLVALSLALASAPVVETGSHAPPHGGLLAPTGEGHLELVVGPERIALFPLDAALRGMPARGDARLLAPDGTEIPLAPAGDHWEAANPLGTEAAFTVVALLDDAGGARASRFRFEPGHASLFHDHRPFHGGQVGMAGDRHLELALAPAASGRLEWQLYPTDAYRQPVSADGVRASLSVEAHGEQLALALAPAGDCLTASMPRTAGPWDVHARVLYPGDPAAVEMDFYFDAPAGDAPRSAVETIRVTDGGFTPSRVAARAGEPLILRFLRTSIHTCATRVVFPKLGIDRPLPLGQPVEISLVPAQGSLGFACGMGMYRGEVVGN